MGGNNTGGRCFLRVARIWFQKSSFLRWSTESVYSQRDIRLAVFKLHNRSWSSGIIGSILFSSRTKRLLQDKQYGSLLIASQFVHLLTAKSKQSHYHISRYRSALLTTMSTKYSSIMMSTGNVSISFLLLHGCLLGPGGRCGVLSHPEV